MPMKLENERYSYLLIAIGVIMLVCNLYYYMHPVLSPLGMTDRALDRLFIFLRNGGLFRNAAITKVPALIVMFLAVMGHSTSKKKVEPWKAWVALGAGTVMYFMPLYNCWAYLMTTLSGMGLVMWSLTKLVHRNIPELEGDGFTEETFRQCTQYIATPDSINIPTRFRYRNEMHRGWINVVNPFRGTIVMGTAGCGKSFSVYGPFIEQMMRKGYCMFVYDYKYPTLTRQVYNEMLGSLSSWKGVKPRFCTIDFDRPTHSLRCNPLNPRYISDPTDASEIADLILLNVNKGEEKGDDFFNNSARVLLESAIWFLRVYQNGRYCSFPHLVEFITQDYKEVLDVMMKCPETSSRMQPFVNALKSGAQEQLQGQVASAQIPLLKFVSRSLYWTLSGDDFPLDINDPEHPAVLCVGNNPDRQMIYGTTIALITSRMFKAINKPGKLRCGVLLDEFPTVFLKGIDNLVATARSNKVAVVIGAQDKSQIQRDYGEKESEVVFNTVANVFSGSVNGRTAEELSKVFGKDLRGRENFTTSLETDSTSTVMQETDMMPVRRISNLSQGVFIGKVADTKAAPIEDKLFCGEIVRDASQQARKEAGWKELPRMKDFGEGDVRGRVLRDPDTWIRKELSAETRAKGLLYEPDILELKVERQMAGLDDGRRRDILEKVIRHEEESCVPRLLQENFENIRMEVRSMIADVSKSQSVTWAEQSATDAFFGL